MKFGEFSYYFNFFYINNFTHLSPFFNNLNKQNKHINKYFFKNAIFVFSENLVKIHFKKQKPLYTKLPKNKNKHFLNLKLISKDSLNFFFSFRNSFVKARDVLKLKFKTIRNLDNYEIFFSLFLSKIAFSSNLFNNSYFKKQQTAAFQISQDETLSPSMLRLAKSSPNLDKFELLAKRSLLAKSELSRNTKLFKKLYLINFSTFLDSFLSNQYNTFETCFYKKNNVCALNTFNFFKTKTEHIDKSSHKSQLQNLANQLSRVTDQFSNNKLFETFDGICKKTAFSLSLNNNKKDYNFLTIFKKKINL